VNSPEGNAPRGVVGKILALFVERAGDPAPAAPARTSALRSAFTLRGETTPLLAAAAALTCVGYIILLWAFVTWGKEAESRILSPVTLPSPAETVEQIPSLITERELLKSTLWSLRRIALGFLCVVSIGLPLGVLAGAFAGVRAFLSPPVLFLRYAPVAALLPLTVVWARGVGEGQKVLFLFLASIGFFVHDVASAIGAVEDRFVNTAATLGANARQLVTQVIFPLALPSIVTSMRTVLGVSFGYIVLAEVIAAEYGLGYLIQSSERRGAKEHIYLVLLVITSLAFCIDRGLAALERWLFPYKQGSGR